MGVGIAARVAKMRPWTVENDPRMKYGPGLRRMHLTAITAAFTAADRIAREQEACFAALEAVEGEWRGPVPAVVMDRFRSMAADASTISSLLTPPSGWHWGIEMPDAMNAHIDNPAEMLRQMARELGRTDAERMTTAYAVEAIPVALRMATSAAHLTAMLAAEGMGFAGHFLDTDDQDGQYLRDASELWTEEYL